MILEKVLETTKYVVENSREMKINKENIEKLARRVVKEKLQASIFFILDSLNFCFFCR